MQSSEFPGVVPNHDPDKCAAQAEEAFQQVAKMGRRQIDAALRVGELMIAAKEQLGHGKFGRAFHRWREEGMVTFSDRSKNRWMLMARHAEAIKSANLANLGEAEAFAKQLDRGVDESEPVNQKTEAALSVEDALVELEHCLVTLLRKLPGEAQQQFMQGAVEVARRRNEPYK